MDRLRALIEDQANDEEFQFELASIDLRTSIIQQMDSAGLSRSDLAERMGVSRARVSQILNGQDNLTLKTLVAIAHALGATVSVSLCPNSDRT